MQKDYPEGYQLFMESNGIKHIVIDILGTKKVNIPIEAMNSIMEIALDCRNYPLLMHCNHGKVNSYILKVSNLLVTPTIAPYRLRGRCHSQGYGMAYR